MPRPTIRRRPFGTAPSGPLLRAARLAAPGEKRVMDVWTTAPGLQVYTANRLDGSLTTADGLPLRRHGAVCLETQHVRDAPNRPDYPSAVVRPGPSHPRRTEFRFPAAPRRTGRTTPETAGRTAGLG
ncbi:hypothetical protein [Streptomyces sp. NPDC053755]|uniref:aldose epimerase family protein n=1 Tax=Streptomyces sp. NPDC053755 TaxID=3155815 RepID=UPI003426D39D